MGVPLAAGTSFDGAVIFNTIRFGLERAIELLLIFLIVAVRVIRCISGCLKGLVECLEAVGS